MYRGRNTAFATTTWQINLGRSLGMAEASAIWLRVCVLLLAACSVESFRGPGLWPHRTSSMRSRHALAAMSSNATGTGGLAGLFGINRNTPEAQANQLAWAREQMDMEMPSNTLEGSEISNREVSRPMAPPRADGGATAAVAPALTRGFRRTGLHREVHRVGEGQVLKGTHAGGGRARGGRVAAQVRRCA